MALLRALVRDQAVAVIRSLDTLAGQFVFSSRDSNLQQADFPAVLVYILSERGDGRSGRGEPHFDTTLTLVCECLTASSVLRTCETDLDTLAEQVTEGLLTSTAFVAMPDRHGRRLFEGISQLETVIKFDASSDRHIGHAHIGIGIKYHDVYPPRIEQKLTSIGIDTDAGSPADLLGTYQADNPGPRTSGPDGRIEISSTVVLPQPETP